MAELIKEHVDRKLSGFRHTPHAGVEHATKEKAGPKTVVLSVLGWNNLVHDGLLQAN